MEEIQIPISEKSIKIVTPDHIDDKMDKIGILDDKVDKLDKLNRLQKAVSLAKTTDMDIIGKGNRMGK